MKTANLTHLSPARKVLAEITRLEDLLSATEHPTLRSEIKRELTRFYKIRKKQKKYIAPPKKINLKRGL